MTEVTEVISPGRVIAIQTTNGRAWQLDLKGVPAEVGQRFAALAIDGPRGLRRHPLAQPISSALPQE
jgi:hypothetical protein